LDKTIVTTLLIIAGVICAVLAFNALYPAVVQSSDAIVSMQGRLGDQMKSQVKIIHAASELDAGGNWVSTYGDGDTYFDVMIWVKNIGTERIPAIERCDLFFGPEGDFVRIPHQNEAGSDLPSWSSTVENGSSWDPTGTIRISVHYAAKLAPGRYFIKFVMPNGVADEFYVGL
jgi:hypothetical protein